MKIGIRNLVLALAAAVIGYGGMTDRAHSASAAHASGKASD
jgi:uncharacterized membrane protein YtjA (UPF0391 family)